MKRLVTGVNNEQFKQVESNCKKNDISIWKLVKDSVLEKINNKTLDDFA